MRSELRLQLVLATNNRGKLNEFRKLLGDLPLELVTMSEALVEVPTVVEDGLTFEQNAQKKAVALAAATTMLTLADDSGLEVDALRGAPGVRSARFAGERSTDAENNAALLTALEDHTDHALRARFRCVLCLVDPWASGEPWIVDGVCEGEITRSPRGLGGFGYDPLFVVDGYNRTMAELSDDEKNAVSHRGKAVLAMKAILERIIEDRTTLTGRVSTGF